MATAYNSAARATAVPVPRNRTRSGSAPFQSKSPPLRSVAELGSSVIDGPNTPKPSIPFGEKNMVFASGSTDPHRDAANIGTENPGGSKVPAFLNKLFSMINDLATDALIYWAADGASFFIPNTQEFGRELLPQFFKHANFTSFVRQLNMYGFKKVPHLQTGTLNTFPQPNNELWEFSNPKFHRDHPDWLAGITRKKSAKELAAAAALAAQGHTGEAGAPGEPSPALKGETVLDERRNQTREVELGSSSRAAKDGADSQSLSKAITLMKDTHTSLERELAELKASNEMLWRQAMLSREEQLKSQKKLDSVMRFLAGQFGNMNMALLEDDNENTSSSAVQPARISRMGKGRLIGDGVNGLDGSPSDEDMDEDAALWESGDREEARQFWEVDDSGKMIKVPQPRAERQNSTGRPSLARTGTPTRSTFNIARMPPVGRKADLSPSKRFERLDGSPEEMSRLSFETPPKSGSADVTTPMSVQTVNDTTRLFPPLDNHAGLRKPEKEDAHLQANTNSAIAIHNPTASQFSQFSNGQYTLDPTILNLPLGTLLSTPAGAQFLATLGQSAASFLGQTVPVPSSPRRKDSAPASSGIANGSTRLADTASDQVLGNLDHHGTSYTDTGNLSQSVGDASMPGLDGDTSWMSDVVPQAAGLPDHLAQPFTSHATHPNDLGNPDSILPNETMPGGQDTDFDWSDPAVKALLLQAFDHHNQQQSMLSQQQSMIDQQPPIDQAGIGPNVFTNDDQYDELFNQDATLDFDGMFNKSNELTPPVVETATPTDRSATTSNAGDMPDTHNISPIKPSTPDELFAGPTRKKRKTDQREP